MAKKRKKKKKGNKKENIENYILGIFSNNPSKTYNYKQLSKQLNIKGTGGKKRVVEVLNNLTNKNRLSEIYKGKYKLQSKGGMITGKVDLTRSGYAFIISEGSSEDIFVSQKNLNHALHGDIVKVYLHAKRKGKNLEGEVIDILSRDRSIFVGTVEISKQYAFLIPDNQLMPYDLFIPLEKLKGAKNGQKATAKIIDWPNTAKNPFGEIVEVLGDPGNHETEMHAILAEYELPYHFDTEIEKIANSIDGIITSEEVKKRRDFRKITTFTIDPEDAKDFDDALSLKKLKNNNWEVGIHIADVTHYVKPKTPLDVEASERATSIYLVDRVIPMLPENLSNNICSLRPNEEKLCFSVVFELDNKAEIINVWYGKTIIQSNKRFTYREAQLIIDSGKGELKDEILKLNELAQLLRRKRFKNGSFDFERTEIKFELDTLGKPVNIHFKEHGQSNELIEEFMLLANKSVAEYIGKTAVPSTNNANSNKAKTFVYRIHDKPDMEKLESFAKFIHRFGYSIILSSEKAILTSLNNLMEEVKGKNEQDIIENLAIRAMAKAIYSIKNIGHYGLAFKYYTHFTSPIRRYPDMMVHRLLSHYLADGKTKNSKPYEKLCQHASEMERKAIDAERASVKYKQVEFMKDKIGQHFEGIISGVTDWGFYVEIIENKCEGLVPLNQLSDDFYEFDEENYCITGRETGKKYQLGDQVVVEILRTSLERKQLDFKIAENNE